MKLRKLEILEMKLLFFPRVFGETMRILLDGTVKEKKLKLSLILKCQKKIELINQFIH